MDRKSRVQQWMGLGFTIRFQLKPQSTHRWRFIIVGASRGDSLELELPASKSSKASLGSSMMRFICGGLGAIRPLLGAVSIRVCDTKDQTSARIAL